MKSGIHLQKKLRPVVTKDGAIVTYRLVHFPKQNQALASTSKASPSGNDKSKAHTTASKK